MNRLARVVIWVAAGGGTWRGCLVAGCRAQCGDAGCGQVAIQGSAAVALVDDQDLVDLRYEVVEHAGTVWISACRDLCVIGW